MKHIALLIFAAALAACGPRIGNLQKGQTGRVVRVYSGDTLVLASGLRVFLAEVDALNRNLGFDGVFQIASLHPQYEFAGSEPDDIANFTNRSPYPTLHLLREESIDRAVAAFPEAEAIYEENMLTLQALGPAGWDLLLAQIDADAAVRKH